MFFFYPNDIIYHVIVTETGCSTTENVYIKFFVFCYVYKSRTLARPGKKNIDRDFIFSHLLFFNFCLVLFSVILWPVLLMQFESV